jgi:DNA recombination protein RmuC
MDIATFLIAVVTLAAGLAAGLALAKGRLDETTSKSAAAAAAANASLAAERDAVARERDVLRDERDVARTDLQDANNRLAGARARLDVLQQNEEQLKDTFARMSTEALQRNNAQFLELASSQFKSAGGPITETLSKMERQLGEIERERVGSQSALVQQIEFVRTTSEALKAETATLVSALRKPQARGRWGELQLKRCLELAGMTARCDFFEQESVATGDGTLRPDVLIRMSENKTIVIDSKVTLSAYLEAYDATDDVVREERLLAHAKHLRKHVNDLAAKQYWAQFSPSPEFVVLFVPGDVFLAAALDNDPMLLDDAFAKQVHIATPTTLISSLRTIAYTWQQQSLADNAKEVFDLGKELYKRLGTFGGHMDKLGRTLTSAVKTYNDSVGSLERNVLSSARKFNDLEFTVEVIDAPTPIEEPVRMLAAGELIDGAERSRPVVSLPVSDLLAVDAAPEQLGLDGRFADYGIDSASPSDAPRRTGSAS